MAVELDTLGAVIKTAYEAEADTNAFTDAEKSKLAAIEALADVTDGTNVDAAGAVMNGDYDANTILAANSDNTPVAVTVAEQRIVGRITGGNITALTAAQVRTLVDTTKVVGILVFDDSEDVATGDGAGDVFFRVPSIFNGWNLTGVAACHHTAGTGAGTDTTDIQIHNITQAADMLTSKIRIDEDETDTLTSANAAVIDTTNDDVATGDKLRFDVDALVTGTAPKGLYIELTFGAP